MSFLERALAALVVAVAACVAALPAGAQVVPPPSLVGEVLLAGPDVTGEVSDFAIDSADCGAGVFTFHASGPAAGPYPGTFTEQGSVQLGAPTLDNPNPLASFSATFTIAALDGTLVTGTKELRAIPVTDGLNRGICETTSFAFDRLFVTAVSYTAEIELPGGEMFRDSGGGSVDAESADTFEFFAPPPSLPEVLPVNRFTETFDTSDGVVAVGASGHVTGGGWILGPTPGGRVSFGFEAKAGASGLRGTCNVIDHATKDHIRCVSVDSLVVNPLGTHATFSGKAVFNQVATRYTIDVDDLGEPGVLDTFKIRLDTGYLAAGPLLGGNIQIHR